MSRMVWNRRLLCVICACFLTVFCVWSYIGTRDFIQTVGEAVSRQATAALETKVEVGGVRIISPFTVQTENFVVYDKQERLLAKAESAKLRFSLFDILQGKTAGAIEQVTLNRLEASLIQDKNGRWNYQDLLKDDEEKSAFAGEVCLVDSSAELNIDGKKLCLTDVNGTADCADMDAIGLQAEAVVGGARAKVSGKLGENMQLEIGAEGVQLKDYLGWLPAGTMPDNVAVAGCMVDEAKLKLAKQEDKYAYQVQARFSQGGLAVDDIQITGLSGSVAMSEQQAITLEINAETAGQPQAGLVLNDVRAKVSYQDGLATVHSLTAKTLGGTVNVAGELLTSELYYDGHALLQDIDLAELAEYLPEVGGRLTADLGFKGVSDNLQELSLYGDVKVKDGSYQKVAIPSLQGSFFQKGQDVTFDYVSMQIENGGELGLEGTIINGRELNLSYIASHIDLSLVQNFVPEADMAGFGDVEGTISGDSSNPVVRGRFDALKGKLFKQPFRTLHSEFGGNLMGVRIKKFEMETDGNVTWTVKGDIGFLGDRYVDLQVDTMQARMEDIAALVAPNQAITGVVDNIITIKGTMADPDIVGYVHMYRGSYNGYLLQGMDGDYTVKNGLATLQDFHVFSPMVDMVLNGTVDIKSQVIDLRVAAKDVDVTRIGSRMPYPISGHGTFLGQATGTINDPFFDGELRAGTLDFNGVQITDGYGKVQYSRGKVMLSPFSFNQGGGSYVLNVWTDINTKRVEGKAEIKQGDIHSILTVLNAKDNRVNGRLDGTIDLAGTVDNPRAKISGTIGQAKIGNYTLDGMVLDASYANRRLQLNRLEGWQGGGLIKAVGTVDLDGPIEASLSVDRIQAGILLAAADIDLELKGKLLLEAQVSGTLEQPELVASFEIANGGVQGSAFDSLTGMLNIHDGVINLEQLVGKKDLAGKHYSVSAHGTIPLYALQAAPGENVAAYDKMNVVLALDEGDLSLLPVVWDQIDWGMGATYGNIVIGGTVAEPTFDGMLGLSDGAVKLKENGIPLTEMNMKLVCSGTHIALEECSGKMGAGRYTLTGQTDLQGRQPVNYNLKLEASRLEFDLPFFKGPLTMDAAIYEDSFYGKRLPKLQTNILVQDALISVPTLPESEGELPHIILDVNLEIGKRVHFYSPAFADFWFSGKVHYGGTTQYIAPAGSIHIDRGKVSYMRNDFRILEGTATFNQVASFLPSLDFFAMTRLNRTKVFLNISGPANAWKVKLSSAPPMSETDIIKMLTLRTDAKGTQDGNEELNAMIMSGLQMAFLGEIEGAMRDILNLDEFNIKRDAEFTHGSSSNSSDKDAFDVQIGKYISDKVMLEYTHGINSDRRRIGMRYEFNDRFSMAVGHDNDSKYWFGLEARIPF